MAGFFFNEDVATPEAIDRRRALINALAKDNLSTAPVGHWTAGLARVLGAAADGYENAKLNEQEKKGTDENKRALMAAFGIGGAVSPGAPTAAAGVPASTSAAAPQGKPPIFAQLNGVNPSLIQSESGGNWQAQNNAMGAGGKAGHFGRLQFGQARLQEAANAGAIPQGTTPQQFMADPNLQMAAERWHFADIDKAIANGPAAAMIGKTINGVPVTQEGLRAVAHLGGVGGMNKFVQSGGAYNPADANGTTLMAYLQRHAGQGIAQPTNAGPSMQPPASAALVAALGSGQPVNVPPGAPAGTPQIVANNSAPVQPDAGAPAPGASPVQAQPQYNVPGVGLVPAQGVGQAPAASPGAGMTPQAAALIQALSSPWAARNPMLAQIGQTMLSQQLAGSKLTYQTDGDGNIIALDPTGRKPPQVVYQAAVKPVSVAEGAKLVDPRTGREIAVGGDKGTAEFKNYEQAVKGGYQGSFVQYQTDLKRAGSAQPESTFDVEMARGQAKSFNEMAGEYGTARTDIANVRMLREQLGKLPGGFLGNAQAAAVRMGIKIGDNASAVEAADAILNRLTPAQRQGMPGAASDRDVAMFRGALPSLGQTKEGQKIVLDTMEALATYKLRQAEIAQNVAMGKIKPKDAMEQLNALPDPFETFKKFQPPAAPQQSGAGKADPLGIR